MKFEHIEHTDRGLVREVNEDNFGSALGGINGDVFVVCDGMGGHVGGKTASTIGVKAILNQLTDTQHNNIQVGISNSLLFANEQVLGHAAVEPSLKGMGSTATVAVIKDDLIYVGHVGDSRIYVFSDGKLYRITRDDSYVQGLVDKGIITEDQAETHVHKNRILQALGSQNSISPNVANKPIKLKAGDLLMLCSDGLTSMVVDEGIEQLINPNDLSHSVRELHKMAMTNGGTDNITITLVKITESSHSISEFDHYTEKYKHVRPRQLQPHEEQRQVLAPAPKKKNPLIWLAAAVFIGGLAFVAFKVLGDGDKPENPGATVQASNGKIIDSAKVEKFNDAKKVTVEIKPTNNQGPEDKKPTDNPNEDEKKFQGTLTATGTNGSGIVGNKVQLSFTFNVSGGNVKINAVNTQNGTSVTGIKVGEIVKKGGNGKLEYTIAKPGVNKTNFQIKYLSKDGVEKKLIVQFTITGKEKTDTDSEEDGEGGGNK